MGSSASPSLRPDLDIVNGRRSKQGSSARGHGARARGNQRTKPTAGSNRDDQSVSERQVHKACFSAVGTSLRDVVRTCTFPAALLQQAQADPSRSTGVALMPSHSYCGQRVVAMSREFTNAIDGCLEIGDIILRVREGEETAADHQWTTKATEIRAIFQEPTDDVQVEFIPSAAHCLQVLLKLASPRIDIDSIRKGKRTHCCQKYGQRRRPRTAQLTKGVFDREHRRSPREGVVASVVGV